MAYAIGHISGCHLNPAVTVGLTAGGRFPAGEVIPYVIAQLVGAIVAALLLYAIAKGAPGFDLGKGFATNGYAEHSPGHYDLLSALLTEVVMTMLFLFVIMGSTHGKAPAGFAPLAIGLCLTLIHLVSIPVTNTSVNPARSTGPALIVGGAARYPTLVVLDRAARRRRSRRRHLSLAQRRAHAGRLPARRRNIIMGARCLLCACWLSLPLGSRHKAEIDVYWAGSAN